MSYRGNVVPWIRLVTGLKYALFFLALLLALPWTAYRFMPGHEFVGGVFLELTALEVLWIAIGIFGASWSLMFCIGLLTDGLERHHSPGSLPARAVRLLGVPVTLPQMALFTAVGALQAGVVVVEASAAFGLALAAAVAGAVVAYVVLLVVGTAAHLVEPGFEPVPTWRLVRAVQDLLRLPALVKLSSAVHRGLSWLFRKLRLEDALIPPSAPLAQRALDPAHFFAATTWAGILALLAIAGRVFFPPAPLVEARPPAGAYGYILILLLIWTTMAFDFHLRRLRLSPLLVLVAIMAVVYALSDADHFYDAETVAPPAAEKLLTPVAVAEASRAPDNLVVVASSGGGILAAGWSTLVLRNMVVERPRLADEIRLLSTNSGGSVGAAYYLNALGRVGDGERTPAKLAEALDRAFGQATASSLDATLYAYAFLDFWRIFFGTASSVFERWDRGLLLEKSWKRIARDGEPGELPTLLGLRKSIAEGRLPAPIMTATVMETGRRVMLTPIDFDDGRSRLRAETQSEFLVGEGTAAGRKEADLGLFTAARLSATFPYVSPAARRSANGAGAPVDGEIDPSAYHLIDGGYYDNYGFTSLLDWLEPVLEARLEAARDPAAGGPSFARVLVVELNPFSPKPDPPPRKGLISDLIGPFLGLLNILDGSQVTRNEILLARTLEAWKARYSQAGLGVCFETVTFRPPAGFRDEPMSWHLAASQIAALEGLWPRDPGRPPVPEIRSEWQRMKAFLAQEGCD